MRILVRSVNWLGDSVLTLPTIRGLKRLYPDAHIAVLVKESLASLFRMALEVDEVIPLDSCGLDSRGLAGRWKTVNELRRRRFDLALILPNSFDSALLPFLARIPERIGYRTDGRGILLSNPVERDPDFNKRHQVYYYYRLLRALAGDAVPSEPDTVGAWLVPPPDSVCWAETFLSGAGYTGGPLVAISAGAIYGPAKRWFPERFVQAARKLEAEGVQSIFFGGPDEASYVTKIADQLPGAINAAGKTDLTQLVALLKRCKVLLTNDTGPMHVAAAAGVPVVALFGSTNPVTTGPFGKRHVVIRHEVPCSPCLKRECDRAMECFEAIEVEEVMISLSELMLS